MATYTRNIQGIGVELTLVEVNPLDVQLDTTNPRVGFSMRQLDAQTRNDPACTLLLTSQEDTEGLKRSIVLSGGVQEPIYIRADLTVAEGNRRVVAMRAAQEDHPGDPRFGRIPAWQIAPDTPESVIQNLLNEIHLGSVRGWAPYEKALQMQALLNSGLVHEEVAERYRMTANEVRQHVQAAQMMDQMYFPITEDPTDAEHRTKYSYFLEYLKNTKLLRQTNSVPDLDERFSRWVRDGKVDTGMKVRRLTKVVENKDALKLLEIHGFDAAEALLGKVDPREQEFYATLEKTNVRLQRLTVKELTELASSPERLVILRELQQQIDTVLDTAEQFQRNAVGTPSQRIQLPLVHA
jgi:hypothetical protein